MALLSDFTKEKVLALNPKFQEIITYIENKNQEDPEMAYYMVWHEVKQMNKRLRVFGWGATVPELASNKAYEWLIKFLDDLSIHN